MASTQIHANRTLRRRTLASGEQRGVEGYFSLAHGEQPSWWRDVSADQAARAIGVFENLQGSNRQALIIAPDRLVVLPPGSTEVAYREVESLEPPRKTPLPDSIRCKMRGGGVVDIPVRRREGQIMDLYRFLLSAVREMSGHAC